MPSYAEVAPTNRTPATKSFSSHDEMDHAYDLVGRALEDYPPGKPYRVAIPEAPVTVARIPYVPKESDPLIDAGTARATNAPSAEKPNGSVEDGWAQAHQNQTVVQQHVDYWDPDHDNIIWPQDTYRGIRAWGWSIPLSLFAAAVIHGGLSYPTQPSILPDPFFRLYIPLMHKANHGSDSMSYDNEGRFRPQMFEDIFAKYDRDRKGGLNKWDLWALWNGQRMAFDFFGWAATFFEWLATYLLLWPEDGILRKEEVRRIYDGSIFQYKADEYARKHGANRAYLMHQAIRARHAPKKAM